MAIVFVGRLLNNLCVTSKHNLGVTSQLIIQTRDYAARKGTRARRDAMKIKKKIEKIEKIGFIDRLMKQQSKAAKAVIKKNFNEKERPSPIDNVWLIRSHSTKLYTIEEAVEYHRETHHPTIANCPNAKIIAKIDLSLQTEKKTKLMGPFTRIINYPNNVEHNESRTIIAFAPKEPLIREALEAGATMAGGKDLIKSIKGGDLSLKDFQYCVAHPDILPDLLLIRGLLKRKFPTTKLGTLSPNLGDLIKKFVYGTKYDAVPDKFENQYGLIECSFGTINMDCKHLTENFEALIEDILSVKPKKNSSFILRVTVLSPPSKVPVRIDLNQYLPKESTKQVPVREELLEEEDLSDAVIPSQ